MEHHDQETIRQIEQLNDLKLKKQQAVEELELKRAERASWNAKLEAEENKRFEGKPILGPGKRLAGATAAKA